MHAGTRTGGERGRCISPKACQKRKKRHEKKKKTNCMRGSVTRNLPQGLYMGLHGSARACHAGPQLEPSFAAPLLSLSRHTSAVRQRVRHEDVTSNFATDDDGVVQLALARLVSLDIVGADARGR